MAWHFTSASPVWVQIAARLRDEIIRGDYSPGQQIPPVRQLATTAAVNPNTMQRALSALEAEGLLCSKGTQGRFVTEDTEVLRRARMRVAGELVSEFIQRAESLSLTTDELIAMLKEAEK